MKEEKEMLELRTKIPKEAYMRIRFIFIKKGKGSISEAVTEAILNDGRNGDMETTDMETALTLMSLPEITAQLAKKADSQEKQLLMMEAALKNLVEFSIHQTRIIDSLQKMLAQAKVTVADADTAIRHHPDEKRDVV